MRKPREQSGKRIGQAILFGIIVALIISMSMAALLSTLILNETIGENVSKYLALVIQFVASMLCGLVAGRMAGEKFALIAGSAVLGYCLLLIAATILTFDSQFGNIGLGVLMCAAGMVVSCLLCMLKPRTRKFK